jgi:hypothetical protein
MTMRNVGRTDALVRLGLGFALLALAAFFNARPFLTLGIGALAALVLGTGLTRSCPLYVVLGLSTSTKPVRRV